MRKIIDRFCYVKEEKEDLGLLLLMQQSDRTDTVSESEVMQALNRVQRK